MTLPEHIGPVTVVRDPDGFWTHPHYYSPPQDSISVSGGFDDWLHQHKLTCSLCWMENDASPQVIEGWAAGNCDISDWQPSTPAGEGWFIGSVHDTEDGPVCVWLREAK
ncbi:hypothetical protein PXV26_004371 [Escherichia coli]|uniref:hypothetical protein n=1 Tax=Atlantibacter hermannii TaxID=565 RepID=UPI00254A605B|nr:hypothetical protein [Atlantibacter hermannii]ELR8757020.1 hypothetical protein [Escherichia coli]MDJ9218096.1 hypothetical protein [Salmonella enterica]